MPTIRNQRSALRAQLLGDALAKLLAAPHEAIAYYTLREVLRVHTLTTKRPRASLAGWLRHHLAARHPAMSRALYLDLVAVLPSAGEHDQTAQHSGPPATGRASRGSPEKPTAPDP